MLNNKFIRVLDQLILFSRLNNNSQIKFKEHGHNQESPGLAKNGSFQL